MDALVVVSGVAMASKPFCDDPGCSDGGEVVGVAAPGDVVVRRGKDKGQQSEQAEDEEH